MRTEPARPNMDAMNETPPVVAIEGAEGSQRALQSVRGTAEFRAAGLLEGRRDADMLGVRRQRDLARLWHGDVSHRLGGVPDESQDEAG
jgi:hypothetical protein